MIFSYTDNLSRALQSVQMNCADGLLTSESTVSKLVELRCDEKFREFYTRAVKESAELGMAN